MEKILEFLSENFQFLVVKFSIYLNRRVFVMSTKSHSIDKRKLVPSTFFSVVINVHDKTIFKRETLIKSTNKPLCFTIRNR